MIIRLPVGSAVETSLSPRLQVEIGPERSCFAEPPESVPSKDVSKGCVSCRRSFFVQALALTYRRPKRDLSVEWAGTDTGKPQCSTILAASTRYNST